MLMLMKVYVEGMRSLLYYVGHLEDLKATADSPEAQARYQGMVDFLIPIAKGYVTDRACEVCHLGIQVYGGYGYIREYPLEQLLRDCRITPIYEGTNGIQAMDLLGRKLGQDKGRPMMNLLAEIQAALAAAKAVPRVAPFAEKVEGMINKLAEVAMHMGASATSAKILTAFAFAHPFLEVCGDMVMAWMLLWRGRIAAETLAAGARGKDVPFYEGQIRSLEFFTHTILPVTFGKMKAILDANSAAVDIPEEAFGGR
jgi:hypothetical protein